MKFFPVLFLALMAVSCKPETPVNECIECIGCFGTWQECSSTYSPNTGSGLSWDEHRDFMVNVGNATFSCSRVEP